MSNPAEAPSNSPLTAVISKEWKQRMWLLMLVTFGMGAWFLFDGLIAYPATNAKAGAHAELQKQLGEHSPELMTAWGTLCKERNWNSSVPEKTYTAGDIRVQLILGAMGWIGAAWIILHYFRCLPLTTRYDNGRIFLPDGREVEVSAIRAFSKKRWENKSIADFAYEPAPGKSARFLLDDYKYIGTAEILAEVEKLITPSQLAPEHQNDEPA